MPAYASRENDSVTHGPPSSDSACTSFLSSSRITTSFPRSGKRKPADWGNTGRDRKCRSMASAQGRACGTKRLQRLWPPSIAMQASLFPSRWRSQSSTNTKPKQCCSKGSLGWSKATARFAELHRAFQNSSGPDRLLNFERMFEMLITKWVDGEVVLPAVESWAEFCARADRGISQYMSANGRGQQLAIFCSAGLIGVAMRRALHLSSQDTLRAIWMVRNSSFSEFLFSKDRFTLSTFNAFPHLGDASLLTYR